jgi:hypothetical protein
MLEYLLDACRRNDLEREPTLVTADPKMLIRQAATGETSLLTAQAGRSGVSASWRVERHEYRTIADGWLETGDSLLSHRAAGRRIARNVMTKSLIRSAPAARRFARPALPLDCGDHPAPACIRRAPSQVAAQ